MKHWKPLNSNVQITDAHANGIGLSIAGAHLTEGAVEAITAKFDPAHVAGVHDGGATYQHHRFTAIPLDGSKPFRTFVNEYSMGPNHLGGGIWNVWVNGIGMVACRLDNFELPTHPKCQICKRIHRPDENEFIGTW